MNIKIERLNHNDIDKFTELISVFEDEFEMKKIKMPGQIYLQQLLENDSFFVFVALLENKVVGGLTSYIMQQYYSTSPLVYIYDLAVKTELQRQGISKMLIATNNDYCKEIGAEAVMVQADEADDYAIEFYHSTEPRTKSYSFEYVLNNKTP